MPTSVLEAFKAFPEIPSPTAAMVGIGRPDWHYAKPEEAEHEVCHRMKHLGFDVVPIQEADGTVRAYWRTVVAGNFEEPVVRCPLDTAADCLPYDTGLLKLAERLDKTRQQRVRLPDGREAFRMPFFFLTESQLRTSPIVGLVADSNLHSRAVFLYSFALISELEALLSRLLRLSFPGTGRQRADALKAVWQALPSGIKKSAPNWELDDYEATEDNDPLEYLSLATLLRLVEGTGYASWLGYNTAGGEFGRIRTALNKWRNYVYHPTRHYRAGDLYGTAKERKHPRQDIAPTLLATRILQALGAAEKMLAIGKLRMKNPSADDARLDRPRLTQVFTSEFFGNVTAEALPAWATTLRLMPGHPADLPEGVERVGFVSLDSPLRGHVDANGLDLGARMQQFAQQHRLETAKAVGQARPDGEFALVREEQAKHNHYREEGVWLKSIDAETLCELGRQLGQESVVWAERDGTAWLLLCDPARALELAQY